MGDTGYLTIVFQCIPNWPCSAIPRVQLPRTNAGCWASTSRPTPATIGRELSVSCIIGWFWPAITGWWLGVCPYIGAARGTPGRLATGTVGECGKFKWTSTITGKIDTIEKSEFATNAAEGHHSTITVWQYQSWVYWWSSHNTGWQSSGPADNIPWHMSP